MKISLVVLSGKLIINLTVFIMLSETCFSQSGMGSWSVLSTKISLNPKWGAFAEAQIRSLKFYDHFHYYEVKGGVNYTVHNNFQLSMAGGHYNTYQSGGDFVTPKRSDEIRLWQQVAMRQSLSILQFEHRYRAEQRVTQIGLKHRFRYRINMTIPLNKRKVEIGTLYTSAWNEIFLTNRAPYFERNRFFAGLGYEVTNALTLQGGYIYQFDYFLVDEIGRQFLQLSALFDFDVSKRSHDRKIPSNVD